MEVLSLAIAAIALVIAFLSIRWAVKSHRAGQRSELPQVRVCVPDGPVCSKGIPLSLKIPDSPSKSSWEITAVDVIDACPSPECLASGAKWRSYFEFCTPVRSGKEGLLLVHPKSSDMVLTCLFQSPRRNRFRSILCDLGLRRFRLRMGLAWEKRWGDAIRVHLKSREGDVSGTD